MNKLKLVVAACLLASVTNTFAGGLLTNTNQNIAFLRNPARDASIGIDGVYSNPAGVAFLENGFHISLNLQNAHQTRTVTSTFAPFAFGLQNNNESTKEFKGEADAPVIPSIQAAYNKGKWSFQFGFAITGGGGKCVFDNGLPSFESNVAMLPLLSQNLDALTSQMGLGTLGLPAVEGYDMETYMRGRQYYFGFTLGAAYKFNEHWSVYGGLRMLYGNSNYYGYVKNISAVIGGQEVNASETFNAQAIQAEQAVGRYTEAAQVAQAAAESAMAAGDLQTAQTAMQQAQSAAASAKEYTIKAAMLGALGSATEDVTLNCDQTGWGVAPIIGVDYKTGNFNFAAKYEFKTRMRLKNKSANSKSAENLEILDRFGDGKKIPEDTPALLAIGAQWSVLPSLRLNVGWHHYFDKDANSYNNHQDKLGGNTNEYLFGAEYDINKYVEISAGIQKTNYDFTDDYMEDISFNVSSYSFGVGFGVHVTDKITINAAYFQTNYSDYERNSNNYNNLSGMAGKIVGNVVANLTDAETAEQAINTVNTMLTTPDANTGKSILYGSESFTRTNRVIGLGVDFRF